MGLSSNQARFLSLTSRQVDLEQRIQQICQRRLRLSSELENVATAYNNKISNRKMFTPSLSALNTLSIDTLKQLGFRVINSATKTLVNTPIKAINQLSEAQIKATYDEAHTIRTAADFATKINADTSGSFILASDLDMSKLGLINNNVVGSFSGKLDGNGYSINNLTINTTAAGADAGLFGSLVNANIKNVALENISINATSSHTTGGLAGITNGTSTQIDNCYITGKVSSTGNDYTGGLIGQSINTDVTNCYSTADVSGSNRTGGLLGESWNNSTVSNCYSTGNVSGNAIIGGLVGFNTSNASITNSYSTGNVQGSNQVGGITGSQNGGSTITNSYSTGAVSGSSNIGAISGNNADTSTDNATNFYTQASLGDAGGATKNQSTATAGWDFNNTWDPTTALPTLRSTGALNSSKLEEGLRNGTYSLARKADEFTQSPFSLNGDQYEEVDWRTTPEIYDELYKGDDVLAEDKYDKIISEINAQDKKLQLEQTSIEVEYKAITSERESVKKILDTNAQASFKYFS